MNSLNIKKPIVDTLVDDIRDTQMIVKKFTYKCKPSNNIISRRASGHRDTSLSLSNQYLSDLITEANTFESKVIKPLSEFCPHTFLVNIDASVSGSLDYENVKVELRISCPSSKVSEIKTFREPLRMLLPFAEYLEKVTVGVHNFRVNNVVGEFTISAEDLLMVVKDPIRYEKLAAQWLIHFQDVYRQSQNVFSFESTIDMFEGKMYTNEVSFDLRTNFSKKA